LNGPLIINFKNYLEISADKTLKLACEAQKVADNLKVDIFIAPPQPSLAIVVKKVKIPVICQHVDDYLLGPSTGFFIPEIAKSFGAVGSMINHSEHRLDYSTITRIVDRLHKLSMLSIVCAQTAEEVEQVVKSCPDYVAIEPPELIGSGKAVSKENPTIITDSLNASRKHTSHTKVICGAGITDSNDVHRAKELGVEGVLVASGIIKSSQWYEKIYDLASGLVA
jgi:triosephosphate isomerase (TIM)